MKTGDDAQRGTERRRLPARRRGGTAGPRRRAAIAIATALLLLGACSGAARVQAPSRRAVLEVTSPLPDAVLWVDGRYVAQLRDLRAGLALSPGPHQIEVRHDRHHAYYGEIELHAGQHLRVEVELAEKLP